MNKKDFIEFRTKLQEIRRRDIKLELKFIEGKIELYKERINVIKEELSKDIDSEYKESLTKTNNTDLIILDRLYKRKEIIEQALGLGSN